MYTLIVLNKEGAVEGRVPLQNGELTIGRSNTNAVILPSNSVSRQHARIYTAQGRAFVEDLKSSNGVMVDGFRINRATEISPTSQLRVGEYLLYLQVDGGGPGPGLAGPGPGLAGPGPGMAGPGPGMAQPPARPTAPPPTVQGRPNPPGAQPPFGMPTPPPPVSPLSGSDYLPPEPPRPTPDAGPRTSSPVHASSETDSAFARLIGINGPFKGEEFVLSERENTIGRTEKNFILLPDASVSREHARIVQDEAGRYIVYDLRSSNQTAVNRKKVQQAELHDGDLVSFGNIAFNFVAPHSASRAFPVPPKSGSRALLVVLGIFLGVLLLAGIIIGIFALNTYIKGKEQERRVAELLRVKTEVVEHIKTRAFGEALGKFDLALELAEGEEQKELLKVKTFVETEKQAQDAVKQAGTLLEQEKYEEAVALLDKVPNNTSSSKEAKELLKQAHKKLDERLKAEGEAACTEKKFKVCQEKLAKYLDRNPTDADALKKLRYAEGRLQRMKILFTRWEPPKPATP